MNFAEQFPESTHYINGIEIHGPHLPAKAHTLECWPLPRMNGNYPPNQCSCPNIYGHAQPATKKSEQHA